MEEGITSCVFLKKVESCICEEDEVSKNKVFNEILSRIPESCNDECIYLHDAALLEACMCMNTVPSNLQEYIYDSRARVRQLALRIALKHDIEVPPMATDPCHIVRSLWLGSHGSVQDFLMAASDQNERVLIAILQRMLRMEIPALYTNKVLAKFSYLITSKNLSIRYKFMSVFRKLKSISPNTLHRLFDRKDLGVFIYASEDESSKIRMVLAKCIDNFIVNSYADETMNLLFVFFIDLLNDEDPSVRRTILLRLIRMAKKLRISLSEDKLDFIFGSLEERTPFIRKLILRLISLLSYENSGVLDRLVKITGFAHSCILRCISSIVSRNRSLFSQWRGTTISPFSDEKESLYDISYLATLLIIKSNARESPEHYRIPKQLKSDLKYLKLLLYRKKRSIHTHSAIRMCSEMHALLSGPAEHLREIIKKYKNNLDEQNVRERYAIEYLALLSEIASSSDVNRYEHYFIYEIFSIPESVPRLTEGISRHLEGLLAGDAMDNISKIEYSLSVPEKVFLNEVLPLDIILESYIFGHKKHSKQFENKFMVVESDADKLSIRYILKEKMRVLVGDPPAILNFYIICEKNNVVCKLSKVYQTRVERVSSLLGTGN